VLLAAFPAPPPAPPVLDTTPPARARRKRARAPWPPALRATRAAKRGRWSIYETAEFERLFGLHPFATLARRLHRSLSGVTQHADKLFPFRTEPVTWTDVHKERFTFLYGAVDEDVTTPARALGVTEDQVEFECARRRADRDGRSWTTDEDRFLKMYYGARSTPALGVVLSRFEPDIEQRARLFQLAKDKAFTARRNGAGSTVMPRWTDEQVETLRRVYADTPNVEIAPRLQTSVKSVVSKAHHLGLKKSFERLVVMGRENVALRYRKEGTCPGS
jgi:hypothetical protein